MADRPPIPASIRLQVMTECGHRCAVCGESSSLELAHIVPWHRCQRHEAENLVVLCAICHARADKEKWGEKVLRHYKENPAVQRLSPREERANSAKPVVLHIEVDLDDFRERDPVLVRLSLASILDLSPDDIRVEARVRREEGDEER